MYTPSTPLEEVDTRGDLVLPILAFISGVSTAALGQLVAEAIMSLVRDRKDPISNVTLRIEREKLGERVLLDIEGSPDAVVAALRSLSD